MSFQWKVLCAEQSQVRSFVIVCCLSCCTTDCAKLVRWYRRYAHYTIRRREDENNARPQKHKALELENIAGSSRCI